MRTTQYYTKRIKAVKEFYGFTYPQLSVAIYQLSGYAVCRKTLFNWVMGYRKPSIAFRKPIEDAYNAITNRSGRHLLKMTEKMSGNPPSVGLENGTFLQKKVDK